MAHLFENKARASEIYKKPKYLEHLIPAKSLKNKSR
jgi:hypothetical protein